MILQREKHLTIHYYGDIHCLVQEWHGFATSAQFRQGINDCITFMGEYETATVISDVRNQGAVKLEDSDWASREALPQMFKIGLRQIAFVVPSNVFSKVSIDNFSEKSRKHTQVKYFDNFDDARAWATQIYEKYVNS